MRVMHINYASPPVCTVCIYTVVGNGCTRTFSTAERVLRTSNGRGHSLLREQKVLKNPNDRGKERRASWGDLCSVFQVMSDVRLT